jgi:serine/threonine protein kinase
MKIATVDRSTLFHNLRKSRLLSDRKLRLIEDNLRQVRDSREIAKALASWKLVTKFQAKMLLMGRKSGFVIGPYCILDQIGHGGMGRVYKAVHRSMQRVVALKVLSPKATNTTRAEKLFRQETQAAARLNHPNIVMAFDANVDKGRHFLAMEYVAGPNLEQYVTGRGPMPIGLACEIVFQAAAGLQHAHERGIVHRDIKPANLLLAENEADGTVQVKILDFGLARLRRNDRAIERDRTCPPLMGTPDFLAPEQARDGDTADIRADLYSLGCTLYYILTGQVPFPSGHILHKLNRHEREQATPIETLRPDVPHSIADIVRKLMAKDPAGRFQTPEELMDALAPHATPGEIDWPRSDRAPRPSEAPTLVHEDRADTEPGSRLQESTSDREGLLEWAMVHRRQRTRTRTIGAIASVAGLIAFAAVVVWQCISM